METQVSSKDATGVPFALAIPSKAREVYAVEEDLVGKRGVELRFFEKNPRLRLRDVIAWDTNTTIEDVHSTDAGSTQIRDGNEWKTIHDTKQDTGSKQVYDRDDD